MPKPKIPEQMRQNLKPQASSVHEAPMSNKTPEKKRLKIPEPLSKELLQLSARASSLKGAPVPNKTLEKKRLEIPEPLSKELLQLKHLCPKRIPERQKLTIAEP
ncbi:hypothetical protein M9458_017934, partial [Cirrhinus mrigala]